MESYIRTGAYLISSIAALRLSPKWRSGRREQGSDSEADLNA
jgi:hypothetical protein